MENRPKQSTELRRQAESKVQEKTPSLEEIAVLPPEEIQKIIHELHVHQIELEMQNEELCRVQMDLGASRQRYLDLYELAPVGYFTLSGDGLILEANLTAGNYLGVNRGMLLNKPFTQFISTNDQDIYYLYRKQSFEVNEPKVCELQMVRQDGTTFWVHLAITALQRACDVIEYRVVMSNIVDRKRAEDALKISEQHRIYQQEANDALESTVAKRTRELQETQQQFLHAEKLSAIGKLSASIAHEFNNPLQGILSIIKGVKKRATMEEEDRELLDSAISESNRMKDLIRNLQDFNRPSSGRQGLMDVHVALNTLLLLHKSDFNGKRISVVLDYAENLPQIMAVSDQIKQVFLNLLANAADACEKHDGVITVSTWQEDDRVAVAIKDTGGGIKPENIELIFQPFFSTKPEVKGTGLGLSVSYGIIKQHHGEIRVESQPGEGATFTVLLPIKGTEETASATGS